MRKTFVLLLVLSLAFIAGCSNNTKQPSTTPYVGGTTGLQLSFASGAPPASIYDGGGFPFDIDVKLQNMGEFTIPKDNVTLRLKGIYAEDYGKTAADLIKQPNDDLVGVRKDVTGRVFNGIQTDVDFGEFNYQGNISGAMSSVVILAQACYWYQTTATADICVRTKLNDPTSGVCTVDETKPVYNSGAPIHVQNFQETAVSQSKLQFTFDITHLGNGKFFMPGDQTCNETYQDQNKVRVLVDTGFSDVTCTGLNGNSGIVNVPEGTTTMRCIVTVPADKVGDYQKAVTIKLDYDYEDSVDTTINLKHAGQ